MRKLDYTIRPPSRSRLVAGLLLTLLVAAAGNVADLSAQPAASGFDKRSEMLVMRDGVKLNTAIYTPRGQTGPLPIILARTPYNIAGAEQSYLGGTFAELVKEGYIFVFQDIRGKYGSEGTFVMIRPPRDPARGEQVDENTDTNDTIDWLLANVPNHNGRVGMLGISYGGWLTMMALVDPHPALKAVSPQASPDDMFLGDDFHHNGAFRLSYGFEYVALLEAGRVSEPFSFDKTDTYEWFLNLGGLANVDANFFHGKRPTWNDFANHPNFDEFWNGGKCAQSSRTRVTVPTLTVAGWWDQEDFYGPLTIYDAMEKNDVKGINYLVVGPWNHGGWARGEGRSLGPSISTRRPDPGTATSKRPGSRTGSRTRGSSTCPRPSRSSPARTRGSATTPGRRRPASRPAGSISRPTTASAGIGRRGRRRGGSTATPPIPAVRCRTAPARSSRSTAAGRRRRGRSGWSTISGTSICGPTC